MVIRVLASALAICVAWMVLDLLLHRYFLAPMYEEDPGMWRPFNLQCHLLSVEGES
jgi:hypothetical protein